LRAVNWEEPTNPDKIVFPAAAHQPMMADGGMLQPGMAGSKQVAVSAWKSFR
jgi:hypothetical protein